MRNHEEVFQNYLTKIEQYQENARVKRQKRKKTCGIAMMALVVCLSIPMFGIAKNIIYDKNNKKALNGGDVATEGVNQEEPDIISEPEPTKKVYVYRPEQDIVTENGEESVPVLGEVYIRGALYYVLLEVVDSDLYYDVEVTFYTGDHLFSKPEKFLYEGKSIGECIKELAIICGDNVEQNMERFDLIRRYQQLFIAIDPWCEDEILFSAWVKNYIDKDNWRECYRVDNVDQLIQILMPAFGKWGMVKKAYQEWEDKWRKIRHEEWSKLCDDEATRLCEQLNVKGISATVGPGSQKKVAVKALMTKDELENLPVSEDFAYIIRFANDPPSPDETVEE